MLSKVGEVQGFCLFVFLSETSSGGSSGGGGFNRLFQYELGGHGPSS